MKPIHRSKKVQPDKALLTLQNQLDTAREELRQAYLNFDQVVDEDLIEACIFQMNAAMAQCNYLVRTIKTHTAPCAIAAANTEEQGAWI